MTMILILNGVSSLIAAAGLAGAVAWTRRSGRRSAQAQPVYITRH